MTRATLTNRTCRITLLLASNSWCRLRNARRLGRRRRRTSRAVSSRARSTPSRSVGLALLLALPPLRVVLADVAVHLLARAIRHVCGDRHALVLGNQAADQLVERGIGRLQPRAILAAVADVPLDTGSPVLVERVAGVAIRR